MKKFIALPRVLSLLVLGLQVAQAQTSSSNGPALTARPTGPSELQLTWPNTNGTFVPERLEQLGDADLWQTVEGWPDLEGQEYSIAVTITNTQQFFRLRQVATNALPPNPAAIAPLTDPTLPTTISDSTAFLYTGTNAIQSGVISNTIVPQQAGVIRGRVLDRDGAALPGVEINVQGHPELGHTWSRLDGRFDLAINAGGTLTLNYHKSGFAPAQRQVATAWQEYVEALDVILLTRDPQVTTIDLSSGAPIQVA